MTRFAILLGGDLTVTARLRSPDQGCPRDRRRQRHDACRRAARGARTLGGRFRFRRAPNSPCSTATCRARPSRPRRTQPTAPSPWPRRSGAVRPRSCCWAAWAARPTMRRACSARASRSRGKGLACLLTSGTEEAWPLIPGRMRVDLPAGTRLSIIPFARSRGARPLRREMAAQRTATCRWAPPSPCPTWRWGRSEIALRAGYGIAIAYPPRAADD